MPTHASRKTRQLRELGNALHEAMKADPEVDGRSNLPMGSFNLLVSWWREHGHDAAVMDDVHDACGRNGLNRSDEHALREYVDEEIFPLDGSGHARTLAVDSIWSLVGESENYFGERLDPPSAAERPIDYDEIGEKTGAAFDEIIASMHHVSCTTIDGERVFFVTARDGGIGESLETRYRNRFAEGSTRMDAVTNALNKGWADVENWANSTTMIPIENQTTYREGPVR